MDLSVQDLEAAINYWRARAPARGNEFALSPEVGALAKIYALMIFERRASIASDSLEPHIQHLLQHASI